MVVSPDVFSEIQGKFLFGYSTFWREFSFKKPPEPFQTIDMISFSVAIVFFTMIDKTMNISSCGNSGISFPSIRTECRSGWFFSWDQWLKRVSFNVINDFSSDLVDPTKNSKYRLFLGLSSPFRTMITNQFSFIFHSPPTYVSSLHRFQKRSLAHLLPGQSGSLLVPEIHDVSQTEFVQW